MYHMSTGHWWNDKCHKKVLKEKLDQAPLRPLHIPHGVLWN